MNFLETLCDNAIAILHSIWDRIKKFFVSLLNFAKNIVSFFKNPQRLQKLKENSDIIAISIKENLESGNYNVVNCLFDKDTNKVVDYEENAQGIVANDIDKETEQNFAGKSMIILQ